MAAKPEDLTNLTAGANPETIAKSTLNPPATFRGTLPATKISMTTANGETCPTTVMRGFPHASHSDGRRIATDIGHGSLRGDGRGWKMSLGALLHFTMGAGPRLAEAGAG